MPGFRFGGVVDTRLCEGKEARSLTDVQSSRRQGRALVSNRGDPAINTSIPAAIPGDDFEILALWARRDALLAADKTRTKAGVARKAAAEIAGTLDIAAEDALAQLYVDALDELEEAVMATPARGLTGLLVKLRAAAELRCRLSRGHAARGPIRCLRTAGGRLRRLVDRFRVGGRRPADRGCSMIPHDSGEESVIQAWRRLDKRQQVTASRFMLDMIVCEAGPEPIPPRGPLKRDGNVIQFPWPRSAARRNHTSRTP